MQQLEPVSDKNSKGWVLVTGASRGIGAAVAERLWRNGFGVILWARDGAALQAFSDRLACKEGRIRWAQADVGNLNQVEAAARKTLPRTSGFVGVVLNAGHGRWRPLSELSVDDWQSTLDGNLTGAFVTLRATLSRLDFSRAPIVLGMLSDSALCAFPNRAAYASAKAGFETLLGTLRREYRGRGLRVSQMYPSRVDTHFAGSHESAEPGMRSDGLSASQVADAVAWIFDAPDEVEIRRVDLSSIKVTFGLEEEKYADAS